MNMTKIYKFKISKRHCRINFINIDTKIGTNKIKLLKIIHSEKNIRYFPAFLSIVLY